MAQNMFNASSYLAANPDVQHGIDQGWFKDAADHFNTVGFKEVQNGRPMGQTLPPVPSASQPSAPAPLTVREGSDFIQNYTNPFEQDVIGAYEKDWSRALGMAQNSNNAQATAQGAFGGSGHGVGTALTNERALDQYGRDVLGAKSQNFNTAVGAGLQDANAYNGMEGLSANLAMQGAALMPQIATTQSSLFNNDLNNLFAIGGAQQGLGQKSLDLSYDDFMKQWQYPMDMLNWASGLASGVPTGAETIGKTPSDVGGKMGGAGGLLSGGAALGTALCWVAREVYGADNPQWLVFRSWMLTKAPKWLRNWYIKHGEKTADFISDKPLVKRAIRWFMDRVV
jgi:hypothetical protein